MTIDRKDDDGDGDDDQVDDLPTEESLLVKLSRRADIALVKGLLVITNLKNTYIYMIMNYEINTETMNQLIWIIW